MIILALESSCDETAAAVVKDGRQVLSSVVATQFEFHRHYSGVVPELASRAHALLINDVVDEALKRARATFGGGRNAIDAIAVTSGPGLVGSLLVGKMTAEALGWLFGLPVYGVNHVEGHLLAPVLIDDDLKPPFLGLVVSGGHTELILARRWGCYERLGGTRDDAAGEAFDKVAKMMGLGYPGGPVIDRLAKSGRADWRPFPRPWLPATWDFSFSGLKTAVLYRLREKAKWSLAEKRNICASFQEAVVDVLVGKTLAAAHASGVKRIVVGGGVAANSRLRERFVEGGRRGGFRLSLVPPALCTDNAAMIGCAAFFLARRARRPGPIAVYPQLHLPGVSRPVPAFRIPAESVR